MQLESAIIKKTTEFTYRTFTYQWLVWNKDLDQREVHFLLTKYMTNHPLSLSQGFGLNQLVLSIFVDSYLIKLEDPEANIGDDKPLGALLLAMRAVCGLTSGIFYSSSFLRFNMLLSNARKWGRRYRIRISLYLTSQSRIMGTSTSVTRTRRPAQCLSEFDTQQSFAKHWRRWIRRSGPRFLKRHGNIFQRRRGSGRHPVPWPSLTMEILLKIQMLTSLSHSLLRLLLNAWIPGFRSLSLIYYTNLFKYFQCKSPAQVSCQSQQLSVSSTSRRTFCNSTAFQAHSWHSFQSLTSLQLLTFFSKIPSKLQLLLSHAIYHSIVIH